MRRKNSGLQKTPRFNAHREKEAWRKRGGKKKGSSAPWASTPAFHLAKNGGPDESKRHYLKCAGRRKCLRQKGSFTPGRRSNGFLRRQKSLKHLEKERGSLQQGLEAGSVRKKTQRKDVRLQGAESSGLKGQSWDEQDMRKGNAPNGKKRGETLRCRGEIALRAVKKGRLLLQGRRIRKREGFGGENAFITALTGPALCSGDGSIASRGPQQEGGRHTDKGALPVQGKKKFDWFGGRTLHNSFAPK